MAGVVEAQYAYSYEDDDGVIICIEEGDRFRLINKSTEDWWKVQRLDVEKGSSLPRTVFYVPAAYMQEKTDECNTIDNDYNSESDHTSLSAPANGNHEYMNLDTYRNMVLANLNEPDTSENKLLCKSPNSEQAFDFSRQDHSPTTNSFGTDHRLSIDTQLGDLASGNPPLSPRGVFENGDKSPRLSPKIPLKVLPVEIPAKFESTYERTLSSSYGIPEENELQEDDDENDDTFLGRSFDEQEGSVMYNQTDMVVRGDSLSSPSPVNNRKSWTLPAGGLPSEWKKITDMSSGRCYYFNERTQESAWKPPRLSQYFEQRSDDEDDDYNENDDTFDSDDAPPGWILEFDEDSNEAVYINSVTQEKWKSCKDKNGQTYYYQVDGDVTAWELPPVEVQYRHVRRRSLDDVLEEKRQSQMSVYNRNSKCRSVMLDPQNSSFAISRKSPTMLPGSTSPVNLAKGHHRRSHSALAYDSLGASTPDLHTAPLTILEGKKVNIVEREGMLFRRRTTEGGKQIKRSNWQQCYVVKYGSTLVFYKDQKSAAPRPGFPNGKPESSLDLRGAILEHVPKDKSRGKKHVFQVRTYGGGSVVQLFADNVESMGRWITCIQTTIKRLEEEEPLPPVKHNSMESGLDNTDSAGSPVTPTSGQPPQFPPGAPTIIAPPPTRNRGNTGTTEKGFRGFSRRLSKKGNMLSEKDEDKEKTKIKDKLRKFMARRPSYSELEKKGIIKEHVFGCHIRKLCSRENSTVPKFVLTCIKIIEEKGLDNDGIYRVCGNVSMVQKLRILIDNEEPVNFSEHQWDDVHIFTGALKLYFRELPEPLFPYDLFDQFVEAVRKPTKQEKLRCFKQLVTKLPPANHDTIVALFKHLKRVIERSAKNRMQSQNISIVFGPTLLRPEHETANMAVSMVYQNQIVDFMLQEFENIFCKK